MDILPQLALNSLITGSLYALATAGLSLSYGLLKILNFAHGHILMLGSYAFFLFYIKCGLGFAPSAVLSLVCAVALGVFVLYIFILPFTKHNYALPFITTLALATMLEALVSMAVGVNVRTLSRDPDITSYEFYGMFITPSQIVIIISAIVLLTLLALFIHHTSFGRQIRAVAEASSAAQALGISVTAISLYVFCASMALTFYAGVLVGFETNLQPTMGGIYTMKAFAAMILGGLGNVWGAVLGSYLLGTIENVSIGLDLGSWSIPPGYKDAFAYSIILLMLLFRPQGLLRRGSRGA